MTCIVGFVEGNNVWIGGDSATVGGYDLTVKDNPKVFRNGDMLIGVCGSPRVSQVLRYALNAPDHDPRIELDKYLATYWIDAVRSCLKDKGCAQNDKGEDAAAGWSAWLVGYKGQLRVVWSDYQVVTPADGYFAIGCGGPIARGALYAASHLPARERVELALQAAERCSAGVRGPFHIECLTE